MKRAFNFATITAFNTFTSGLIGNQKETLTNQKQNLENTVKRLEQEVKSLTAENEAAASEIASLQSQIASLQGTPAAGSIAGLRSSIATLKLKIQANKQKIQAAKSMITSSKRQIQKIKGTLSTIEQKQKEIQNWLQALMPDIQEIDRSARGKLNGKLSDLLGLNGKLKDLQHQFGQNSLNTVLNINKTKRFKNGQINNLPNTSKNPNISNLPFDGKSPKVTPTVAIVDDAAVGALLLLFALGVISREQVAAAIGVAVEAIGGILDQLKNGLISVITAVSGIMSSVAGDDSETKEDDNDTEDSQSNDDERYDGPNTIPNDSSTSGHIFRDAPGHLKEDTPENRGVLEDVANDPDCYLGKDQHGNEWYARNNPDGTQTWAKSRNGNISNGGINDPPKTFNPNSGLSAEDRPW